MFRVLSAMFCLCLRIFSAGVQSLGVQSLAIRSGALDSNTGPCASTNVSRHRPAHAPGDVLNRGVLIVPFLWFKAYGSSTETDHIRAVTVVGKVKFNEVR